MLTVIGLGCLIEDLSMMRPSQRSLAMLDFIIRALLLVEKLLVNRSVFCLYISLLHPHGSICVDFGPL